MGGSPAHPKLADGLIVESSSKVRKTLKLTKVREISKVRKQSYYTSLYSH